ncbi:hypothetical protein BV20DRAFT_612664 [Pilatotrama ljubarskyi]|nr:hypothetical protein BV20DRAFT_612664 [Pilatotrama ljubarskyi]
MDNIYWENALNSIFDIPPSPSAPQVADSGKLFPQLTDGPTQLRHHNAPSQVVTPPASDGSSVFEGEEPFPDHDVQESTVVSVSTTFHPLANLIPIPSDLTLISSDDIYFYVHTTQVLSASTNRFNNIVSPDRAISDKAGNGLGLVARVSETAVVLNIILHCVYGISFTRYKPALDTLITVVDAMPSYGLSPKTFVAPSTLLYASILGQAPLRPVLVYALAARHDLYELAKPVSSYLLSLRINSISDEVMRQIGPVYLKRLSLLQVERERMLKQLLFPPPHPHAATQQCDFEEQKKLARAWALATAYLAWDARPDLPPSAIQSTLSSLADYIPCHLCKKGLADRIRHLLIQWSFVKRTI